MDKSVFVEHAAGIGIGSAILGLAYIGSAIYAAIKDECYRNIVGILIVLTIVGSILWVSVTGWGAAITIPAAGLLGIALAFSWVVTKQYGCAEWEERGRAGAPGTTSTVPSIDLTGY